MYQNCYCSFYLWIMHIHLFVLLKNHTSSYCKLFDRFLQVFLEIHDSRFMCQFASVLIVKSNKAIPLLAIACHIIMKSLNMRQFSLFSLYFFRNRIFSCKSWSALHALPQIQVKYQKFPVEFLLPILKFSLKIAICNFCLRDFNNYLSSKSKQILLLRSVLHRSD